MAVSILKSRLHRLLSGRLVLVSFTDPDLGQRREIPARYGFDCHGVQILVPRARAWWRDFQDRVHPVTLRIKGEAVRAEARAIADQPLVAGGLINVLHLPERDAERAAPDWVLIRAYVAAEMTRDPTLAKLHKQR